MESPLAVSQTQWWGGALKAHKWIGRRGALPAGSRNQWRVSPRICQNSGSRKQDQISDAWCTPHAHPRTGQGRHFSSTKRIHGEADLVHQAIYSRCWYNFWSTQKLYVYASTHTWHITYACLGRHSLLPNFSYQIFFQHSSSNTS